MSEADDLARLLVPPPGEDVIIRDAVIREWDPNTFENVVEYEGIRLRNVDVGAGAAIEALTYRPGDLVQLELRFSGGRKGELGIGDVAIRGRRITPGTGAAEKAVAFMQTTLARQLSLEIIQDRVHQGVAGAQAAFTDSTPGLDFVDHPQDAPARVSGVEVVTGVAIVMAFSGMSWARTDDIGMGGSIAVDISGATTIPAGTGETVIGSAGDNGYAGQAGQDIGGARVFTGLNPGLHNFEIKYRAQFPFSGSGSLVTFDSDTLVVIAF